MSKGGDGCDRRWRTTVKPSISGMLMSRNTRSGAACRIMSRGSAPSDASATWRRSDLAAIMVARARRARGSSSTTRTFIIVDAPVVARRHGHPDARALTGRRLDLHRRALRSDRVQLLADCCDAQSRGARPGLRAGTGTIVLDDKLRDLALGAGDDADRAASAQGRDAMAHRVLHQRLQEQRRDEAV